jgi:hypothetical protein
LYAVSPKFVAVVAVVAVPAVVELDAYEADVIDPKTF